MSNSIISKLYNTDWLTDCSKKSTILLLILGLLSRRSFEFTVIWVFLFCTTMWGRKRARESERGRETGTERERDRERQRERGRESSDSKARMQPSGKHNIRNGNGKQNQRRDSEMGVYGCAQVCSGGCSECARVSVYSACTRNHIHSPLARLQS